MDLNADLGEGGPHDAELIALVSSANIACGGHAGDVPTMRRTIDACLARGVAIGAHPGYEDPASFGRRNLHLAPAVMADQVSRQIARLASLAEDAGTVVHHVKPHGALYTQADQDPMLAAALAAATAAILPSCRFYVPPGGALATAGAAAGLRVCAEGFADRRYDGQRRLLPRSHPAALIDNPREAAAQALEITLHHQVRSADGVLLPLAVDTLCVHGDEPGCVTLLTSIRDALMQAGYRIQPP